MGAQPVPARTAAWLAEIGEKLRDKLAAVGLVAGREPANVMTVSALVEEYKGARTDVKAELRSTSTKPGKRW